MGFKNKEKEIFKAKKKICSAWMNSIIGYNKVESNNFGQILSDGILLAQIFYKTSDFNDHLDEKFFSDYSENFNKLNNVRFSLL